MFQHTIAAISTALQDGAISIIRLSGDEAISIVQSIFSKTYRTHRQKASRTGR